MFIVFNIKENFLKTLTLEEGTEDDYVYTAFKTFLISYSMPVEELAFIPTAGEHSVVDKDVGL